MISAWNSDIKSAPHGRYEVKQRREGVDVRVFVPERVVLATKCGKVTISHYQPEVKRWEMLADGEMPVAWAPYTPGQKLPEHPYSAGMASERMNPSADHVSPPARNRLMGSESANAGDIDVDGSAARAGCGGQPFDPLAGQVETRSRFEVVDGNASLAAREGEKPLHSISHSSDLLPPPDQADSPAAISSPLPGALSSEVA